MVEREERMAGEEELRRRLEGILAKAVDDWAAQLVAERGQREAADNALQSSCIQLREAIDEAQKWRIQQYNELSHELSKITELLAQEAKTRQSKDESLSGEVTELLAQEAKTRQS